MRLDELQWRPWDGLRWDVAEAPCGALFYRRHCDTTYNIFAIRRRLEYYDVDALTAQCVLNHLLGGDDVHQV